MNDSINKSGIVVGVSPSDPKEVFKYQEELIQKAEASKIRAFAFERRQRLPYLIQKQQTPPYSQRLSILLRLLRLKN